MKPKDSAVLPLSLVSDYGKKYPFVWDAAQQFRDWPEADWDKSRCYIPIAAGCAICDHFKMPPDAVYMVPALAAWRQSKEIYTFDPDLADALYAQADDTKIPSKILMQLPFFVFTLIPGGTGSSATWKTIPMMAGGSCDLSESVKMGLLPHLTYTLAITPFQNPSLRGWTRHSVFSISPHPAKL